MLLLDSAGEPPPPPPPPPRRRRLNRSLCLALVAALWLVVAAERIDGLTGYVLLLAAITVACWGIGRAVPARAGALRDHRQ